MDVISYSVSEEAAPFNPTDMSGGYGTLSYTTLDDGKHYRKIRTEGRIDDPVKGVFSGIVRSVEVTDGTANHTVDALLSRFNVFKTVAPYNGTLGAYLLRLVDLCGIPRANVSIVSSVSSRPIKAAGFNGNVWDKVREIASIKQFEVAQIQDIVTVRPVRAATVEPWKDTTRSVMYTSESPVERILMHWYDMTWAANHELIIPDLTQDSSIQVDAGETVVQEYKIDGSLASISQPEVKDYVAASAQWGGTAGAYCVAGNDGKPITAAQWKAQGGSLKVKIMDDPSVIEVTVKGASGKDYAPYTIAATAGSSSYYNSLHITGTGFYWFDNLYELHTGAIRDESTDPNESEIEIDTHSITSIEEAHGVGVRSAQAMCVHVERTGTSTSLVPSSNPNQTFGNSVGARMTFDESNYRVMSLEYSPEGVSYTTAQDNTCADFNTFHGSMTVKEFNMWYNDLRVMDFNCSIFEVK